jgi:hypothetical protein
MGFNSGFKGLIIMVEKRMQNIECHILQKK